MRSPVTGIVRGITAVLAMTVVSSLSAQTIRSGFDANSLGRTDDASTDLVPIGFGVNFFGIGRSELYVNNNGNVSFDDQLGTFTPFDLLSTNTAVLAPFFADVDTRNTASQVVTYGTGTVNGHNAFGANWVNVGYYNMKADKLNSMQLVIISRNDIAAGDFDFEFNYGSIRWETGDASGGVNGLGGDCARAGWSNGVDASFEIPGSAVCGAFLDGGPNSLATGTNVNQPGRFLFQVRNGLVTPPVLDPTVVPEPATYALVAMGLLAIGALRRRTALR